jgi:RNA polymerase sigma-70 factor (ECF subfamily)
MTWQPPWAHGHTGLNGLSGLHGLYGLSSRDWYKLAGLMALWSADDERGLIALAQQGDRSALEQLFEHYRPELVSYIRAKVLTEPFAARPAIAEEIANDTLVKVITDIRKFDPSRGVKFSTWMFTIAKNTAVDRYRRIQAQRRREERAAGATTATVGDEGDLTERVEAGGGEAAKSIKWSEAVLELLLSNPAIMQSILAKLTPFQREAFRLREIEHLPYAKIAQRLGVKESTAKVRVFEARNAIDREFLAYYKREAPKTRARRSRT